MPVPRAEPHLHIDGTPAPEPAFRPAERDSAALPCPGTDAARPVTGPWARRTRPHARPPTHTPTPYDRNRHGTRVVHTGLIRTTPGSTP